MLHSALFYTTDILTKPNRRTFKDFPNAIRRLSRTKALFEDFSGPENKRFQDIQQPAGILMNATLQCDQNNQSISSRSVPSHHIIPLDLNHQQCDIFLNTESGKVVMREDYCCNIKYLFIIYNRATYNTVKTGPVFLKTLFPCQQQSKIRVA